MKSKIFAVFLLALFSQSVLAEKSAGNKKQDGLNSYKCHLLLANRAEVIRDYRRLPANHAKKLQNELVGMLVSLDGNNKSSILEVKECVAVTGAFRSAQGRELDRTTLR